MSKGVEKRIQGPSRRQDETNPEQSSRYSDQIGCAEAQRDMLGQEQRENAGISQSWVNKEGRRWKRSAACHTIYGITDVERNSCEEAIKRGILQDRSRPGWQRYLGIGIDVLPKWRDYAEHPNRRCQYDREKNRRRNKPNETRPCGNPTSKTNEYLNAVRR